MGEQSAQKPIKRICAGLLAHVDAGKTTLSESMLYLSGSIRKLGRVDHRDAFLDTYGLEKERGITIFSKPAALTLGDLEAENEFTAYVDENLTEAEARALQSKLEAVPNVDSVTFVTAQQALENYKQRYVDSEYAELFDLPSEVLRHRYQIHVVDIEQLAQTVKDVEQVDGIAKTQAALDVAQGFVTVRNVAGAVAWILILMLLIISLFIIANPIKLATFHRREEIAIMRMVGATNGFIRFPFFVEGTTSGLISAAISSGIVCGAYYALCRWYTENPSTFSQMFGGQLVPLSSVWYYIVIGFVLLGFVLCGIGTATSIRKHLNV